MQPTVVAVISRNIHFSTGGGLLMRVVASVDDWLMRVVASVDDWLAMMEVMLACVSAHANKHMKAPWVFLGVKT